MIDFVLPNTKSESLKNVQFVSPKQYSFAYFVVEPPGEFSEKSDPMGRVIRTIILVRQKCMVPAPRVWTYWEHLMHVPPRYVYNVWMDSQENPEHYWSDEAKLETWDSQYGRQGL